MYHAARYKAAMSRLLVLSYNIMRVNTRIYDNIGERVTLLKSLHRCQFNLGDEHSDCTVKKKVSVHGLGVSSMYMGAVHLISVHVYPQCKLCTVVA